MFFATRLWEGEMHSANIFFKLTAIITAILIITIPLYSQDSTNTIGIMDVSNITSWVMSDGFHPAIVGIGGVAGSAWNGNFPKGTAGGVYQEGVVWGGKVFDGNDKLVRVGGASYFNGNYALTRLYRVRPFYDEKYLKDDAANTFLVPDSGVTDSMINMVYLQYKTDWNEWPADKGAPFYDKNKDGKYEPDIDIPGIPGASQTIWISYDDRNSPAAYGSPPIGLEVKETYWAYDDEEKLNNVIFKNVKIIYKGLSNSATDSHIDSMYITEFSDIDDGYAGDDFAGCDTSLDLGYVYNSTSFDQYYDQFSLAPPAIGYTFLQGVAEKTGNISDSAIVDLKWRKGYRFFNSIPMTGFIPQKGGDYYSDPTGQNYKGTLEFYNIMRGYRPDPPYPSSVPFLDFAGKYIIGQNVYMLSGDPITRTGWIDGIQDGAGDRRMHIISGPFYLNLGDTAEVTMALVGGLSTNNITSVFALKYNTQYAIISFSNLVQQLTSGDDFNYTPPKIPEPNLPEHYLLSQNYPNPFNPTTTIEYELPNDAFVKLVVYDVLGRVIKTLVSEYKSAGSYKVIFDGSNLASGVYFYRITFTNSDSKLVYDNLGKVIKMMLIK
jgi:Secretion system C-terminal sorting domain